MMGGRESKLVLMDDNGIRCDGRKVDETRRISIKAGVLRNANGSAYIEFGDNKIIAGVYGPRDVHPKHMSDSDTGILRCRYHMTPFSVGERKNPAPSRREIEISKVIKEALLPAVMLEKFPRTAVDVYIEVLQADGGTRCAALDAASVALADAVPMREGLRFRSPFLSIISAIFVVSFVLNAFVSISSEGLFPLLESV